ncbi:hypothetical protein LXA43DRAFT_1068047 [Ganoderma leucocontextum]|nr:hypothetical protein LXA43DRAFT_1068047 [Ganoderma leucocontextum]
MPLSVFIHDGQVYASPTRTSFPPRGPPSLLHDNPTSTHVSPSTWERCMWAKRDYLELAFYPTSTHLDGELFRHLRFFRKDSIPLEERSSPGSAPEYRLAHALQLYELEKILFDVRQTLQRKIGLLVGLEKEAFPGPSSESYTSWSRDKADVRNRAFFARKKFLYHIAMISFHIAIITYGSGDDHRWYSVLLENGVPGTIADKLSSTMVADFGSNVPRAGVFIQPDQQTAQWAFYVRVLISTNVPVYVAWGPLHSSPAIPDCFKNLYPSKSSLEALRSSEDSHRVQYNPPLSSTSSDWTSGSGGLSAFAHHEPAAATDSRGALFDFGGADEASYQPVPQSGDQVWDCQYYWKGRQLLPGEQPPSIPKFLPSDTPGSFFSRRAAARHEYISHIESPQQKAARLAREKNALLYRISQKGRDEVYEWDFDDDTMRWKRSRVPRKERETVWEMYSLGCKRYDSVAGEWDVAEFLDHGTPELSTADEYDTLLADGEGSHAYESSTRGRRPPYPFFRKEDYQLAPPTPSYEPPKGNPPAMTTSSESTVQSVIIEQSISSISPPAPGHAVNWEDGELQQPSDCAAVNDEQEVPNIVTFLEVLMGFHAFRWGSSDVTSLKVKRLSLADACKAVGFYLPKHGTGILEDEPHRAPKIIAWVSSILDKQLTPPPDWWCLHPDSQDAHKKVLMTKGYPLRLSVLCNKDDGKAWWCLHKQYQHQSPWFIAVEDATVASAAIQSRRSWDDIARWMIASGISFHTLMYSEAATHQHQHPDPRPPLRLTIRPFNHKFTAADFEAYEYSRRYIFRDPRIARAALLAGGILWRLAIEEVAPDVALDGLDLVSAQLGIGFRLHDKSGYVYVDDDLTHEEISNIVGMYFEQPDRNRIKWDHDTYPMWWPLPRHFKDTALDFPTWTPVDENWYPRNGSAEGAAASEINGRGFSVSRRQLSDERLALTTVNTAERHDGGTAVETAARYANNDIGEGGKRRLREGKDEEERCEKSGRGRLTDRLTVGVLTAGAYKQLRPDDALRPYPSIRHDPLPPVVSSSLTHPRPNPFTLVSTIFPKWNNEETIGCHGTTSTTTFSNKSAKVNKATTIELCTIAKSSANWRIATCKTFIPEHLVILRNISTKPNGPNIPRRM